MIWVILAAELAVAPGACFRFSFAIAMPRIPKLRIVPMKNFLRMRSEKEDMYAEE